jgi:hypothetical protein
MTPIQHFSRKERSMKKHISRIAPLIAVIAALAFVSCDKKASAHAEDGGKKASAPAEDGGKKASAPTDDGGLVVLEVGDDKVRVRSAPSTTESQILAQLNAGAVLVAKKRSIQGDDMSWYEIVSLVDKDAWCVADTLQTVHKINSYPYISANFVKPYGGERPVRDVLEQVKTTPYGEGYGAVDSSQAGQRGMVERRLPRMTFLGSDGGRIPVYAQPSAASRVKGYHSSMYASLAVVDSRPGWALVVDMGAFAPSGWMEADKLYGYDAGPQDDDFYRIVAGHLVALNLGANIEEILRRWGPGKVEGGTITAKGFEAGYYNYRNFNVTLTRPGAGLGGIFVGTDWCDRAYIQRTFGAFLSVELDEDENLSMAGGTDGWRCWYRVTFDDKGRVKQLTFYCEDIDVD